MDQSQIEKIIRERIDELRSLESTARHRSLISYQDKRDELEALLLRIHGSAFLSMTYGSAPEQGSTQSR
jgi:hypothetical protein